MSNPRWLLGIHLITQLWVNVSLLYTIYSNIPRIKNLPISRLPFARILQRHDDNLCYYWGIFETSMSLIILYCNYYIVNQFLTINRDHKIYQRRRSLFRMLSVIAHLALLILQSIFIYTGLNYYKFEYQQFSTLLEYKNYWKVFLLHIFSFIIYSLTLVILPLQYPTLLQPTNLKKDLSKKQIENDSSSLTETCDDLPLPVNDHIAAFAELEYRFNQNTSTNNTIFLQDNQTYDEYNVEESDNDDIDVIDYRERLDILLDSMATQMEKMADDVANNKIHDNSSTQTQVQNVNLNHNLEPKKNISNLETSKIVNNKNNIKKSKSDGDNNNNKKKKKKT